MSVAEHADDAAALLEALGATPAVVVARSYGGEVATDSPPELRDPNEAMAAALPDARAVLVGASHLIDPADAIVLAFLEEVLA